MVPIQSFPSRVKYHIRDVSEALGTVSVKSKIEGLNPLTVMKVELLYDPVPTTPSL